jgi:amino acid transporter
MCDGLVCAELGASMPRAGGPYEYLKQIYGPSGLGRLVSFLVYLAADVQRAAVDCVWMHRPRRLRRATCGRILRTVLVAAQFARRGIPLLGRLEANIVITPGTWLAMGTCLFAVALLYRRISSIGRVSKVLWGGVLLTVAWVISAGVTHFHAAQAFAFPPGAFEPSTGFFTGLGAALLVTAYDYWGYYNICYLAGEVEKPERNVPRAVLISVAWSPQSTC